MAYFAQIKEGIVKAVIAANDQEWCETNIGGIWIQTSYNTYGGQHRFGGTPLHKNYAGIGYHWDGTGFYAPQPYESWTLNEETYIWEAPKPRPTGNCIWDESMLDWVLIN